ncbi:MAG: transporter-related protein [Deltaproteobacteria bacterium]|nr:transporter-related protein [Deltaproteobacteria bacterium]
MLTVSDLSKSYGKQVLFEGASFLVGPGERVGLVGRNGHGKTTLFRILLKEESPDGGTITVPAGYRIGHLAQRLEFHHPTVLAEAASALPRPEEGTDETYRAKTILAGLGFGDADLSRPPGELSGGFQVRLNLARVLVSAPDLLLLDEPTNYLDIVSIRWLRRFLCAWKGEMILITHDRGFMDGVTTHTMAIHRCRIRKLPGGTEKLYQQIVQEETIHEQTRVNDDRKRKEAEAFINRFRAQATKAKAVQSRIKALARHDRLEKLQEIRDLDFRFNEAPFVGKWMLEARGLTFGYDPRRPLIERFSLAVGRGDRIAVVGPNGKGKTTLIRLLAGELAPGSGDVRPAMNVKIGHFGQTNVDRLHPGLSIEEEVRQANPSLTRTQVRSLCGAMMFGGDAAEKRISVLSGGERSRVLLARLLAAPVNLLLLDEPTNHLDQESVDAFLEALDAFDGAVVIVTHVERVLSSLATRLVVFDGGKVELFEGGYADFLERVGWRSERTEGDRRPERGPRENRKDERRRRAAFVARRSRELGVLRSAIEAVEAEILSLEEQVVKDDAAIVEASIRNDGPAIREAAASASAVRKRIDALYEELAGLGEELQGKEREFEDDASEPSGRGET